MVNGTYVFTFAKPYLEKQIDLTLIVHDTEDSDLNNEVTAPSRDRKTKVFLDRTCF